QTDAGVGYYIYESGGRTINNNGTFQKSAGAGTATVDSYFVNTGTTLVQTGSVRVTAGGSSTGSFVLPVGTVFSFQSNYLLDNGTSISGAGVASIDGPTVTVNGTVNAQNFGQTGGTLAGTGTLHIASSYAWTGGNVSNGGGALHIAHGA